jgi:ankyrin repeat protein
MEKEYSGQSAGDHHSSAHLSDDDINAFFQAVEEDDVEKINESLRLTPDLVHAFFDNTFALSFVNSEAVLDLLLAANANINSTNSLGESALFFLNENMIEPMLRRRADPNVVTHAGETVLSVAKNENREFLVKLLIEANADPEAGMNEAEPSPPSVTEPVKSHQRSDVSVKHTAGTHAAYAPSQQVQLHVSPMERKQPTPSAITADVRPGVANSNVVQCIYNKKHFVVPELFQVT